MFNTLTHLWIPMLNFENGEDKTVN